MPSATPTIRMSDTDHRRLSTLVRKLSHRDPSDFEGLEDELNRAEVVPAANLPHDVVSMYSSVVYEDLDSGKVATIQLTYPEDASVEQGRVSVLAPVGAALLGLKVGHVMTWPLPDGRTARLKVKHLEQPRSAPLREQMAPRSRGAI